MRKFKYSDGDVVGNLEIKGLGGTSKSGTRLYSVLCLLCGSVTDKRLQTIEGAKSCGCMQSKRDRKVVGSGRRTAEGTRVEGISFDFDAIYGDESNDWQTIRPYWSLLAWKYIPHNKNISKP